MRSVNGNIWPARNVKGGLGLLLLLSMLWVGWVERPVREVPLESHMEDPINILFVSVDDLRPELGCYGSHIARTPHFDAFAKDAFVFERAVCAVPVCGASRASLMTGLRPNSHRFRTFSSRADEDAPNVPTMAAWLKSKGYTTLSNGKIFHKNSDSQGDWSEKPWRPKRNFKDYQNPENIAVVAAGSHGPSTERGHPSAVYADDLTLAKSLADLERLAQSKSPFFFGVGFFKPHLPFCAPGHFWDLHHPDSIGLASNRHAPYNAPEDAMHSYGELRAYEDIPNDVLQDVPDSMQLLLRHGYQACVSHVDHLFGQLLAKLQDCGLADNTVVVVWGDHGWQLGEHNLWAKHCNFQTSLKVPLLIRLPGQTEGHRVSTMTELTDLYPTLCAIVGVDLPTHLQGTDLRLQAHDAGTASSQATFTKFHGGETITTEAFSYTEFRHRKTLDFRGAMLFDLEADPQENHNVADDPAYALVKVEMARKLDSLHWISCDAKPGVEHISD